MRSTDLIRPCRGPLPAIAAGLALGLIPAASLAQTDQEIADAFTVSEFTLQQVEVRQKAPQHAFVDLVVDGEPITLNLFRTSVRSPDFKVLVVSDTGVEEFTPAPSRVFKGTVVGDGEARATGTIVDGAFSGTLIMGDTYWGVQPLTDAFPNADPGSYIVYEQDDTYKDLWKCGVEDNPALLPPKNGGVPLGPTQGGFKVAEVAFDTDFEFFQDMGSNEQTAINFIEARMAGVNAIYETEVGITHVINEIIIRTDVNDPYTTSNPSNFLGQFQNHWLTQQQSVQRDVAHLWTGKNLQGGVIGIAFLNGVCSNNQGFGLSQRFTTSTVLLNCLMAHEMGHNWAAQHCDGTSGCAIMCSAINSCGNGCTTFGNFATNSITQFSNIVNCLDDGVPPGGGTSNWTTSVSDVDGDNLIEAGETATVTLTLNFSPDNPDNDFLGLAATIFDVLNLQNAETGEIAGWQVLNDLDALTGDLTTLEGVELLGVEAGQLTMFGVPFTPGSPIDVFQFEWKPNVFDGQVVAYTTNTDVVQAWEFVPSEDQDVAFDYAINEEAALFVVSSEAGCPADCNADGQLNVFDFVCFQGLFSAGDPAADCNNDGQLNVFDFVCFQSDFGAGCP